MVKISSLSFREREFCDYLKKEFAGRGLQVEEDQAGTAVNGTAGNLLVKVPGDARLEPILLAAHMDTVVPGEQVIPVWDEGIIKSKTDTILGADDKAGIAAILEAVDVLLASGETIPPLEILLTICEEQGLLGAKNFDYGRLRAKTAYVLDSGGRPGTIVIQSPCQNEIEYRVTGKPAHAGINPEDGLNAIHIMAKAVAAMPCGRIDEETTCNFGIIEGGLARNIVAEKCTMKGEARSLKREKLDQLTERLIKVFTREVENNGGVPETTVTFLYPEITLQRDEKVVKLAAAAAEEIGLKAVLEGTGGGSDASIINSQGIRCANLGIGMSAVHTLDEYIRVEDLVNDARWLIAIIRRAAQEG